MVDVIHTDSFYGLSQAIGHQDFYPNVNIISLKNIQHI